MTYDKRARFEDVVRAVGLVCIAWSDLEWELTLLAADITRVITPEYDDSRISYPFEITFSQLDIREKIMVIKVLAHTAGGDETFYDDVNTVLNDVDNNLRPERNRYVHDQWLSGEFVLRIQHLPKIFNVQARQRKLRRRSVQKYDNTKEMFQLVNRIDAAIQQVRELGERTASFPRLTKLP